MGFALLHNQEDLNMRKPKLTQEWRRYVAAQVVADKFNRIIEGSQDE